MNLNPTIFQRKDLHDFLWDHVEPNSTYQIQLELEDQKFIYHNEACRRFPIDADTTPALFNLCQSVKERLHVHNNIMFCIENDDCIANSACLGSGNTEYPSIVRLTSGAVNMLTDNELAFLVGHELGHIIIQNGIVQFFFWLIYKDPVPNDIFHLLHVYRMLSELEADRYGYMACGSLETYVNYQYKLVGGIDRQKHGVSVETFLTANQRHVQKFLDGGWVGGKHPAEALRTEAVRLFATCKTNRELRAKMKPIINSIYDCYD